MTECVAVLALASTLEFISKLWLISDGDFLCVFLDHVTLTFPAFLFGSFSVSSSLLSFSSWYLVFFSNDDTFTYFVNFFFWLIIFFYSIQLLIWVLYETIDSFLKIRSWNTFLAFYLVHCLCFLVSKSCKLVQLS